MTRLIRLTVILLKGVAPVIVTEIVYNKYQLKRKLTIGGVMKTLVYCNNYYWGLVPQKQKYPMNGNPVAKMLNK